jgi:hypothetical protein
MLFNLQSNTVFQGIMPQSVISSTITATPTHSVRRSNRVLNLQKNVAFERSLWEFNANTAFIAVSPRHTSSAQLLPLDANIRLSILRSSLQAQKLFLFHLSEVLESLTSSISCITLEEAGLQSLGVTAEQNQSLLPKVLSSVMHSISVGDGFNMNPELVSNSFVRSLLLQLYFSISLENNKLVETYLKSLKQLRLITEENNAISLNKPHQVTLTRFLRRKRLELLFNSANTIPQNATFLQFISSRLLSKNKASIGLKQFIWKRGLLPYDRNVFYQRIQPGYFFSRHHLGSREVSGSLLYLVRRIEDKYRSLSKVDKESANRLLEARNYLLSLAEERLHRNRQTSLLLVRPQWVRSIRRRVWRNLLAEALVSWANTSSTNEEKVKRIFGQIAPFLARPMFSLQSNDSVKSAFSQGSLSESFNEGGNNALVPQRNHWRRLLRTRRLPFANKKIVEENSTHSLKGYTDLLSQLTGREVSVFFINTLSLTRFAFQEEGKGKSSQRFLQNIDREMVSRYKYVAVYIQDFVRVSFISLFLKKPTFLAQFMALQISKLPRNRKETKMLRFLIKVIKIFAAQRREVVGLRILFKGRVNRWRRTKQVVGEKGILPLQSLDSRIEFGSAKAITRKGTLGIRLWICYNPVFRRELRKAFLDYVTYSQELRRRSLHRFWLRLQPRELFN